MQLDPAGAAAVLDALAALERRHTVPRIEGAERRRLRAHAGRVPRDAAAPGSWVPHRVDGWYLGLRPDPARAAVVGEAGRLEGTAPPPLVAAAAAGATRVWVRGADPTDVAAAEASGWHRVRTLHVLTRALVDPTPDVTAPPGLRLVDLTAVGPDAVAAVLARAYAPARDAGRVELDVDAEPWTPERLDRLAAATLSDPADLLVAVDGDGRSVGVHWLRRRTEDVGEVFNLAVAPEATGHGVGRWLLAAGLARLAAVGLGRAILWVDAANTPALALYAAAGFAPLGQDVAVEA